VLVGGAGARLPRSFTTIPATLVPVGGEVPIIEVVMRQLSRDGFKRVTLVLGHLGHLVRSLVGDGSRFDLQVSYWQESRSGSVGLLIERLDELPEHVLILNGDLLCSLDFRALMEFHLARRSELTLAASTRKMSMDFGILDLDGDDLHAFRERPELEYQTDMGVYAIARIALERLRSVGPLTPAQLVDVQLANGRSPKVFRFDGCWLDVRGPESYERASVEFRRLRTSLLPDARPDALASA